MGPPTKRKRKSEPAEPGPQLKRKRKRKSELSKVEEQLKRKRARSDKLWQRQGALFEDAGEQELVFKKKSKRNKEGTELKLEGTEGELELNPIDSGEAIHNGHNLDLYSSSNRNGQALDSRSTMDEQSRNPECREIVRSESSKEGQTINGQKADSKRRKKEQKSKSERSNKGQQSHSDSSEKEDNLKSDCNTQEQELRDAEENNEEMLNMSKDIKESKKKKNKKKRDRWGQVLNDVGNTKDSFYEDGEAAMPDNFGKPEDATLEDGTETLTKHDRYALMMCYRDRFVVVSLIAV